MNKTEMTRTVSRIALVLGMLALNAPAYAIKVKDAEVERIRAQAFSPEESALAQALVAGDFIKLEVLLESFMMDHGLVMATAQEYLTKAAAVKGGKKSTLWKFEFNYIERLGKEAKLEKLGDENTELLTKLLKKYDVVALNEGSDRMKAEVVFWLRSFIRTSVEAMVEQYSEANKANPADLPALRKEWSSHRRRRLQGIIGNIETELEAIHVQDELLSGFKDTGSPQDQMGGEANFKTMVEFLGRKPTALLDKAGQKWAERAVKMQALHADAMNKAKEARAKGNMDLAVKLEGVAARIGTVFSVQSKQIKEALKTAWISVRGDENAKPATLTVSTDDDAALEQLQALAKNPDLDKQVFDGTSGKTPAVKSPVRQPTASREISKLQPNLVVQPSTLSKPAVVPSPGADSESKSGGSTAVSKIAKGAVIGAIFGLMLMPGMGPAGLLAGVLLGIGISLLFG